MIQKLALWLLLTGCSAMALAQVESEATPVDTKAQHASIEQLRRQKSAEFDKENAACASRFAVVDCQNDVGLRRRQMLAELKLQDAKLHAMERQQKRQEQLLRTEQKMQDSAQRQKEARAAAEENQAIDRQKILDDKRGIHREQAQRVRGNVPVEKSSPIQDAAAIQKNREAYLDKQKALEKRRQERDQRLLDHGKAAAPLPLPP